MRRISTIGRLSIGLVLMTTSIILGADMLGLIPDKNNAVLAQREKLCESLAIYCSVAAQKNEVDTIYSAAQVLVQRNKDILSAAVRQEDGTVIFATMDHDRHWQGALAKQSTQTHVRVPIYEGESLWGKIEVAFQPVKQGGMIGFFTGNLFKLISFVVFSGFILYRVYLRKTLKHMDPSTVVPPRVKAALDALAEGVVLLDKSERIVLVNSTFETQVNKTGASLTGQKLSHLGWTEPKSSKSADALPWIHALQEGETELGVRLGLPLEKAKWRTFTVNGAPIVDSNGNCRGALATFDDVTQVVEQNDQLQLMLGKLEKSRDEIRRQNKKLEILASRDLLTNCLNRRAFFEVMDTTLSAAKRYEYDLCCIMVDIDHFKSVNDTHGHAKGDEVLKGVSGVIQSLLRKSDVICRYGGEEFCVILPHTSVAAGAKVAERFRQKVEARKYAGIPATISLGVSSLHLGATDVNELINQADKALYEAKEKGRNRVVDWHAMTPDDAMETSKESISKHRASQFDKTKKDPLPQKKGAKIDSHEKWEKSTSSDEGFPLASKDALQAVSQALNHSSNESKSRGLQAAVNNTGDAAVQLNKQDDREDGWAGDGTIDNNERLSTDAILEAASVLKQKAKRTASIKEPSIQK
jgi:diguanylate cyclase (GGDEF)-like protein